MNLGIRSAIVTSGILPKRVAELATMTFARRLARVENIQQQDSAEKAFNKLARTFVLQMDTLKKYRSGGEQRITVQHVTVNDGGQAVVGNINAGGKPSREGGVTDKSDVNRM